MSIELTRPLWLLLLGIIPVWWWWARPTRSWSMLLAQSGTMDPTALRRGFGAIIELGPKILRALALACLILAMCHPRWIHTYSERVNPGVGVVFAIDLSTSMRAEDMAERTTRLQAAKTMMLRYLERRTDAVGLIGFAGEALTRLPLTRDRYVADATFRALQVGLLKDGTDIAGAIAAAAGLLRDSPHEARVVILITDGAHNKTGIEPARAAAAAAAYGVKIYAMALGNEKRDEEGVFTDAPDVETVLTQAARITGGRYFRAADVAALDRIYSEIDAASIIPAAKLAERTASRPLAPWLLAASLVLLLGGSALRGSRWGVIP